MPKFEENMRMAFRKSREDVTRCTSSNCAKLLTATHYLGRLSKHSLLVAHVTVHIAMKNYADIKDNKWLSPPNEVSKSDVTFLR